MEKLVEALEVEPADAVLEVGYGLGFSAAAIQGRRPRRHVVVECDEGVLEKARAVAGLEVAASTWQRFLVRPPGERYDAVFFDDFPIAAASADSFLGARRGFAQVATRGSPGESRWRAFLEALEPHLARDARITGYVADVDKFRRGLPPGFTVASEEPCDIAPPPDCPYVSLDAGDALFVVVVRFVGEA